MSKLKSKIAIIASVLMLMLCATFLSACSKPKTFTTVDGGLSITVTSDFKEKEIAGQTMYLESKNSIVTILKEEFSLFTDRGYEPDSMTEMEYADLVIKANKLGDSVTPFNDEQNSFVDFSYEKTVSGRQFYYFAVCKKGKDAFWLCQFGCTTDKKDDFKQTFIDWAKTITLN